MRFLLFFIISVSVFANKTYFHQMNNKEINNIIIKTSKKKNFLNKIVKYSWLFTKTPYKLNVLGEGKKKPLYSFKAVDCVTYIETVLALANSNTLNNSISLLQKIRYKNGEIKYNKRNHFMVTQWIPNNKKLGIIEDITKKISNKTKKITKTLTLKNFKGKFKKFLSLQGDLPLGKHEILYIPLEYFLKNHNKMNIPSGTIMLIIRENNNYPIFTSHLGFIIKYNNELIFRSAVTNRKYKEVRDYKLISYLNFYKNYFAKKHWGIIGISLFMPKELKESNENK